MFQEIRSIPKRGFTLVELLVVIAILAVLTVAVVLVLNPGELLKQSRDAQRISDFATLKKAISLYLVGALSPAFGAGPIAMAGTTSTACFGMIGVCSISTSTAVDGSGWIKVNFNELSASTGFNSIITALPVDPTNNTTYHYVYGADAVNKYYELNAILESNKYAFRMVTDGGNSSTVYEVGNAPGLSL